ncbi:N-acetylmannosamine-6-phosphate 2-epimerase [Ruania halotolerans]|uniref:N-acetylmannosamine-6-phosphate 2-epimerase n=1 Tax=Ruania halotolerans TaxID=2897773 RepID=UPI001E37410C|nr:N-acetylmannosamine-6-phosphate 2-epimerase [Ruania halotolerans]UFU06470.1 N-acetylmannosamine-6-phosphate 2-epimerase [Ruania halotolerans]
MVHRRQVGTDDRRASVPVWERLRGELIVSCQAYPGEPMRDPRTTTQVALSVVAGGAAGLRLQGTDDIRSVAGQVDVPIIGLWKDGTEGVFITPTLRHALAVAEAGAQVVALDGTRRPRPDGRTLAETITELRAETGVLVMADCGSVADAVAAQDAGADLVSTTLSGYSGERPRCEGPDLELVTEIVEKVRIPVVAEGRVRTPQQAAEALERGAFAVCVGTAITHPASITRWFRETLPTAGGR